MQTKGTKQICENRQARHEYFILEQITPTAEVVREIRPVYNFKAE